MLWGPDSGDQEWHLCPRALRSRDSGALASPTPFIHSAKRNNHSEALDAAASTSLPPPGHPSLRGDIFPRPATAAPGLSFCTAAPGASSPRALGRRRVDGSARCHPRAPGLSGKGEGTGEGMSQGLLPRPAPPRWGCPPTTSATTGGPGTAPGSCRLGLRAHLRSWRLLALIAGPGRRDAPRSGPRRKAGGAGRGGAGRPGTPAGLNS